MVGDSVMRVNCAASAANDAPDDTVMVALNQLRELNLNEILERLRAYHTTCASQVDL